MYPFRFSVYLAQRGIRRDYEGEFTEDEHATLNRFVECEEELATSEYVKAGMPLEGKIAWDADTGFAAPTLPPAAQIREFLHLLRPFLLEKEPTAFNRVRGLVARRYVDPDLRNNFKLLDYSFSGKHLQSLFKWSAGDLVLNSEAGLTTWLNAFEYHRDADKRKILQSVSEGIPLDVQKVLFIDLLREKTQAVWWLGAFVRCALVSEHQGHTITL